MPSETNGLNTRLRQGWTPFAAEISGIMLEAAEEIDTLRADLKPIVDWFASNRYTPNVMMTEFLNKHPELLRPDDTHANH